jgi:PAS domain S-box-containing protein
MNYSNNLKRIASKLDAFEIFKQVPVAICIYKGNDYNLEFANDFYLQILGRDKSIIGKSIFISFPELENKGLKEIIDGVIANEKPVIINDHEMYLNIDNKNVQSFFNCVYQPLEDSNGGVTRIIVTFTNVTEQVLAKNKNKAFQQLLLDELTNANIELAYQKIEKGKRADELGIANKELVFQDDKKEKLAAELIIANKELIFQNEEKSKRAAELIIADIELAFQNKEKDKREILNRELEAINYSEKLVSKYARSLIEASHDPMFTISPNGKITDMNNATVKTTGFSREQLIGTDFYNYFTEPNKAKEGYLQVFDKGFVVDYPLTIKDHKLTDVLFNGSVYKDEQGNTIGAVVVARDITEQKRIENELTEAKVFAELATIIAEDAQSKAEEATRLAKDAVRAKQQFLSNMSHEIRTPMNAIIGFTKVVLKTELSVKQKEYLNAIKMSGDALILLINDILDLAKVDAGKMVFEKTSFKLSASISAMLHLFEPKIEEKNLLLIKEYDEKIPEVLVGDPVRLHQIILNLISNAVKFTNKGNIKISIKMLEESDRKVTIQFAISDTGIGITEGKKETIFENFQQASSGTSRLYGGTGLGLAIVKQLVENQDGQIEVESKEGKGSTFSFTLDFLKTNSEAELVENELLINSEIKNIKVLVVEDIALNQLLMRTLLDDFGFECDIASNGKIAIEKLQKKSYDIVLMDLQMPEMNGFEATDYIRKKMKSAIPIMALTADVTTVDLAKCNAVGMNDYVAKPINEKILYNKIIGLIKKPLAKQEEENSNSKNITKKLKYIDLDYLTHRTKSNPVLMMEMISLYLEQTPALIISMKSSFASQDWETLKATVHKMIPSFAIMGINADYENMAKKVQEFAHSQQKSTEIGSYVNQLENVCNQSCIELQEAFNTIKNKTDGHK